MVLPVEDGAGCDGRCWAGEAIAFCMKLLEHLGITDQEAIAEEVELVVRMGNPLKVLVVYQHLPHYRSGVFVELDKDPSMEITFAADISSKDGSIPVIPSHVLRRCMRLRNRWVGPFLWQRGLMRAISRGPYELVIFLGDAKYLTTWLGMVVARLRRIPTRLWTIGWHRPDAGLRKYLRVAFYRLSDGLLLYGVDGFNIGLSMGYPSTRMQVIGNSHGTVVDLDHKELSSVRDAASAGALFTVGAVVRLNAVKRLDLLLHAARILKNRGSEVRIIIAGDGPERRRLESLAEDLGVDAHFEGAVYDASRLREIYRALDLTVLPDAAGLTVMQSLSHGVPVVTADSPYTQMPEFRAVVPGVTGDLFTPGDADELAGVIERWRHRLVQAREDVARACFEEIRKNWSAQVHAERIRQAIFQQAAGHRE